ncbi:SGNH/GDSL hydrolase family protein [Corynebacterium sp. CCM 9186]|uniref:SGNH/GDSL hydrolase family protein n=1 Tax=Corynebacterium meridianum TaxID=2765363 RepID=UPI00200677C0|nr:SGNH/GDSL hydrolase family protein [Corynebacterium meridianum]MCK7677821.1 SGNH/GDSL hydrolase family protein [Corynebacterium meridianum]
MRSSRLAFRALVAVSSAALALTVMPTIAQGLPGSSTSSDIGTLNKAVTSSWSHVDARAPEGGAEILVFGDSHTGGINGRVSTDERGCMHSDQSWPRKLRDSLGMVDGQFIDASCWGAILARGPGTTLADQVRYVESLGGLGPATSDIFIQLGYNEAWSRANLPMLPTAANCIIAPGLGCTDGAVQRGFITDPNVITPDEYAARIEQVVTYLRYYAPNSRIHLVGYTETVPENQDTVCIRIGRTNVQRPGTQNLAAIFHNLRSAQRGAADKLGLNFIDLTAITAGHDSCSADPWLTGIFDGSDNQGIGLWHPTPHGNWVAADAIRRAMGR